MIYGKWVATHRSDSVGPSMSAHCPGVTDKKDRYYPWIFHLGFFYHPIPHQHPDNSGPQPTLPGSLTSETQLPLPLLSQEVSREVSSKPISSHPEFHVSFLQLWAKGVCGVWAETHPNKAQSGCESIWWYMPVGARHHPRNFPLACTI
jgi:hypothetical protein